MHTVLLAKKRKRWLAVFVSLSLLALLFAVLRYLKPPQYGHVHLSVLDAYTLMPIQNAYVVLPEHGLAARTDGNGKALLTNIPVPRDKGRGGIPGKTYAEATMVAYGDGYTPCVLFYAHVFPDTLRSGPTIYLFPEQEENAIAMIELPNEAWVRELIRSFAPEGFVYGE